MARFDRVIPPGGTGEITVEIDTKRIRGNFEKKVVVWSNDLERRSIVLYLTGMVEPRISLEPGGYLSLNGSVGIVPVEYLEIINKHKRPMKIKGIENDLENHIRWHLDEIRPGYSYKLEVEDISKIDGDYSGHLVVRTDVTEKPEIVIIINGHITKK